jgi:hypothetical protein
MFNKSLVSENIRIFKGEWPFKMEYSNYLLNGHAAELLCGVKERDFNKTTYYQIDWKKLNSDHNEIIRAVFELSPDFKGYAKDRAICKQERLKEVLRIDKSNKKSKRQSPKYPNYTFEMYRPKKSLEDID